MHGFLGPSKTRRATATGVALVASLALAWGCTKFSGTSEGASTEDASDTSNDGASAAIDASPDVTSAATLPCKAPQNLVTESFEAPFPNGSPPPGWSVDVYGGGTIGPGTKNVTSGASSLHAAVQPPPDGGRAGGSILRTIADVAQSPLPHAIRMTFDVYLDATTLGASGDYYVEIGCSLVFKDAKDTAVGAVLDRISTGDVDVTLGSSGVSFFVMSPPSSGFYHVVMLLSDFDGTSETTFRALVTAPGGQPIDHTGTPVSLSPTSQVKLVCGIPYGTAHESSGPLIDTWVDSVSVDACQ